MVTSDLVDTAVFFATAACAVLVLAALGAVTCASALIFSAAVYGRRRLNGSEAPAVVVNIEPRQRAELAGWARS
ncbi:hypothetical protein SPF06_11875 [Sinomonas sp. JGH33]|uniref:Uncharacterized protein n=1 Tax=Sinomonas terricola TaxID=3110330 RepID=A0ABU5T8K8_9MICC|nr:hypothetical protein [Sinomonas sp. JGH33]MEA5455421.1 hypothetical protein [Sinomonas sp. JGH33]